MFGRVCKPKNLAAPQGGVNKTRCSRRRLGAHDIYIQGELLERRLQAANHFLARKAIG
jgi:hypothetical protein